jgi:hypothetical protein
MVENIFLVLLSIGILGIIFGFFMLFRNNWVYIKRSEILNNDYMELKKLIPYTAMVLRFWCWDINKMKKNEEKKNKQIGVDHKF